MRGFLLGCTVAALFLSPVLQAGDPPHGIPQPRLSNDDLIIDTIPQDTPAPMTLERVFPDLSFPGAVLLLESPDDSGRLFVVSRSGVIWVFDKNNPTSADVFLDISNRTCTAFEQGLFAMAFDPDYATNGEFYVHYTNDVDGCYPLDAGVGYISRFTNNNPADNDAEENSEEVLLEVDQPYANHNGGMIAFGPDDMLYIALGDGGSGGDPLETGQDNSDLLGSILRIDVRGTPDAGLGYAIPPDNPLFGQTGVREEIWAYGLRNPWRFSFDMIYGTLFVADVGQNNWEEVNVVTKGGNYGWDIWEGNRHCYEDNGGDCGSTLGFKWPIVEYGHTNGRNSITGGFASYSPAAPSIYGHYIFGDFGSREIFSIKYPPDSPFDPITINVIAQNSSVQPAGFGQDADGEVYVLDFGSDGVYVLRENMPSGDDNFPRMLSELPALHTVASGGQVDGVIPYAPSAKLWSDNTDKERYIALPGLTQIERTPVEGWNFPEGTVIVKNFTLPMDERDPENTLKRIETRLLVRNDNQWHGFSYEWNEEETDARLLTQEYHRPFTVIDENGMPESFNWQYPGPNDCFRCHTGAANVVLGPSTLQMNGDFHYPVTDVTDNQLRALDWVSVFTEPLGQEPSSFDSMPSYFDESAPIEERARAYLVANCAHCHRPGGGSPVSLDFRWQTENGDMNAIDENPILGSLGIENGKIIAPGEPQRSVLLERMNRRGTHQMPPLGTNRVDDYGVELIRQWISDMGDIEGWILY